MDEISVPKRVASLAPSITASLFDLGLGGAVCCVTDYCRISPCGHANRIERVGGPKTIAVEQIVRLKPDLVIANQEENTFETVAALQNAGIQVWVTFPKSVREAIADLWKMGEIFRSEQARMRVEVLERMLEWQELSRENLPTFRYFCPVWMEETPSEQTYFVTFNRETYSNDVLRLFGGENVFAERQRLYPLEADLGMQSAESDVGKDTRYPRVSLEEVTEASPEVLILTEAPFDFSCAGFAPLKAALVKTPAVEKQRFVFANETMIHCPGTCLAQALAELPARIQAFS